VIPAHTFIFIFIYHKRMSHHKITCDVSLCDGEFPLAQDKDHILPSEIRTRSHRAITAVLQDYQQALHFSTNFMGPLFMLDRVNPAHRERIFTNGAVFPLLSQTGCSLLRVMSFFTGSLLLRLAAQDLFDSACFVRSRNHRRKARANFNFGTVSAP